VSDPPKNVVVLGSTGSVGTQTLDVVRSMPDRFRVLGLSGHSHWELLAQQAGEFAPRAVAVTHPPAAAPLRSALDGSGVQCLDGRDALVELARWPDADVIVGAVSGTAGVAAALAAVDSGKLLALANKESIVSCGPLLMARARESGATVVPVDSEHSAAFQLLSVLAPEHVARVVLTASGGPFYRRAHDSLDDVTPDEACAHPTWQMGRKITVDCANLMNKALEIVEARWLFGLQAQAIGVLVHPQSVVHCMVELVDGTLLAHMGPTDMRMPILYALGYPERLPGPAGRLDLCAAGALEFHEPDTGRFPALRLGRRVAEQGGTTGAVLSAADEVAVGAFLAGRIKFTDIVRVVESILDRHEPRAVDDLDQVRAADTWAREETERCLASF
jgi:1-deoxy-D-xylulose-5-phosphate reductoisomerase